MKKKLSLKLYKVVLDNKQLDTWFVNGPNIKRNNKYDVWYCDKRSAIDAAELLNKAILIGYKLGIVD